MAISEELVDLLVCPEDKGPLWYFHDESSLYNERLKRRYSVRGGNIPVLLVDDADAVGDDEHERLVEKAASGGARLTGRPK